MPLRVSPAELKNYMVLPASETTDLVIFIEQASSLVDELLVNQGLSTSRLKFIELNLSAHYATLGLEKGGFKMQKVGESMESYQDAGGANLGSTCYGQQAVALDPSGALSALAAPKGRAEFRVV